MKPPGSPAYHLTSVTVPAAIGEAAVFWKVTRKTIQRWLKSGRENRDPCPYREPGAMLAWYQRTYSRAAPDEIIRIAESYLSAHPAPDTTTPPPPADAAPAPAPRTALQREPLPDTGDIVSRLRAEEAALHQRYLKGVSAEPPLADSQLKQYRDQWQETVALLDTHLTNLKRRGEILTQAEVDAAFQAIILNLPAALERAFPPEAPPSQDWKICYQNAIRAAFTNLPATLEAMLAE